MADEGMWLLPLLKEQNLAAMQRAGLQMDIDSVYSADGVSLKDGVVLFGGGCTGELISSEGLVLTNHHCGYAYIQQHSSVENDLLTNGFWAMSREEELPNPGLTVTFTERMEDVTAYVKEALEKDTTGDEGLYLSAKFLNALAREYVGGEAYLNSHPGTKVEIKPLYGGNVYYLYVQKGLFRCTAGRSTSLFHRQVRCRYRQLDVAPPYRRFFALPDICRPSGQSRQILARQCAVAPAQTFYPFVEGNCRKRFCHADGFPPVVPTTFIPRRRLLNGAILKTASG